MAGTGQMTGTGQACVTEAGTGRRFLFAAFCPAMLCLVILCFCFGSRIQAAASSYSQAERAAPPGQAERAAPQAHKEPAPFTLTLLHSNDSHSAYGGFDADGRLCYASRCPGGQGGYARLHQALGAIRRDRPDALLLDAGDFFQGSLYWTAHKAAMPIALLRHFDYLAVAPGNHEFDEGCGPCLEFWAGIKARPLAANLTFSRVPQEAGISFSPLPEKEISGQARLRPYMIHEVRGRKIGLAGLASAETPLLARPCGRALFEAEEQSLRRAVAEMRDQGAQIIVALTHVGLETDRRLAAGVDGLDIIVGGHSHDLLANGEQGAAGPYPEVVLSPQGRPVLIVTSGANSRHLGLLEADFDGQGELLRFNGDSIPLTDDALRALDAPEPDPELEALLERFSVPVRDMFVENLGEIPLPGVNGLLEADIRACRKGPCPTGEIVAAAMLAALPDTDVVLLNSGALRHSLPVGPVTYGDVLETFPFTDRCLKTVMSGATLLAALEHGLSGLERGEGRFLQTAGLRYVFDAGAAPGSRLRGALAAGPDGVWRPVDKEGDYLVVTLEYLARGGDGFAALSQLEWSALPMGLVDMLRSYLARPR